jgi:hypothetical protein
MPKTDAPDTLRLALTYTVGDNQKAHLLNLEVNVYTRNITEPIKSTFLHPSGTVAYCVIWPPAESLDGVHSEAKHLPVLVNLHGAGVQAQDSLVRHQLDSVGPIAAWTIFPEGGSPWSGDDWRRYSLLEYLRLID